MLGDTATVQWCKDTNGDGKCDPATSLANPLVLVDPLENKLIGSSRRSEQKLSGLCDMTAVGVVPTNEPCAQVRRARSGPGAFPLRYVFHFFSSDFHFVLIYIFMRMTSPRDGFGLSSSDVLNRMILDPMNTLR